jgi:SnoaL-like domain
VTVVRSGGGPMPPATTRRMIMTDYQDVTASYLAVWNETDPAAREGLAAKLFTEDVRYTDPLLDVQGVAALAAAIGAAQRQFPGWRFRGAGPADGHHNQVRFGWELGPADTGPADAGPDAAPVAGFDVAVLSDDGRISLVLGFLDRVPG